MPLQTDAHAWVVAAEHSLAELVNQCATIERLLDALGWAIESDDVAATEVLACHPTTTDDGEFDLW